MSPLFQNKSNNQISIDKNLPNDDYGELKVTRDNIKFTMFYDKESERFYI